MPWWSWSRTSASNATADPTINFAEGQAPSSVNDSARALMAASAMFRDDISGAIVTGGTSTAYTVTSLSVYDTLAHMNGALIAFTPHTANGATVTLNVDGLGAKPLRTSTGVELQTNVLIAGTPYMATYNNSDAVWYLHGLGSNAYGIPLAGGMDYWGSTAPSSAFAFPTGQAISRTTYASLFTLFGTTYGVGNGSTTFNLPDKSGRASVGLDSAGRLANVFAGNALGATGGADTQTLGLSQIPTGIISAQNGIGISVVSNDNIPGNSAWTTGSLTSSGALNVPATSGTIVFGTKTSTGSINVSTISNNTSGLSHPNVQPTICCNYIIRVI